MLIIVLIFFLLLIMPIDYFSKYIKYKNKYISLKNNMSGGTKSDIKVILFSADWCGHCKKFKPEWEKLKKKLSNKYTFINYKDTDKETTEWKINGFPTIYIANKDHASQYYGERQVDAITEFITNFKK